MLVDEIRRLGRRHETDLEDEAVAPAAIAKQSPERTAASREVGRGIQECLLAMKRERRLAVTLHLQGHTVPETARILGTVGVVYYVTPPSGDEFRTQSDAGVQSLVPVDVPLPRGAFRLRWTHGPQGSRYQVRVTTEDLQVLATAADLTEPVFTVDPARLAALRSGASVFWQVDVSLPSGGRLTSPTFITRVE